MPSRQPEWFPPGDPSKIELPAPAGYRRTVPVFPSEEPSVAARLFDRKRRILWFGVAVALHAALFLGIWLSPPLRLVVGYGPDRWVQVVSLPKAVPVAPILTAPKIVAPAVAKTKARQTKATQVSASPVK